jgi:succinoglycan biosynthesis transport protein ExoP
MPRHEDGLSVPQNSALRIGDGSPQFPSEANRPPAKSSGGVLEFWQLFKRRKLLIGMFVFLGALAAFVMLVIEEPVYNATTTLELQGFNESFMNMNTVDPQANTGNYTVTQNNINTQIRIIESASIRMPVIERLRRETAPVSPPVAGTLAPLRKWVHGSEDPLVSMKKGIGTAVLSLKAKGVLNTRIIAVSCQSTIPEIAASFVNTVANEYMAQNAQQRSITNQKTAQWLETQLEENKVKLEQAENRLQDFVRQSGLTVIGEQDTLANSRLRQLMGDLTGIQSDRISKQARYEQLKNSPFDSLPDIAEAPGYRIDQAKLADLKKDLNKLSQTLTPANPKIQQVQEQIAEVTAAMEKEKQVILERARSDYEAALHREKLLTSAYSGQAGAVSAQADKATQYALLKREVEIFRQTQNNILSQANQASVVSAVPANNIRVIDPANTPGIPSSPIALNYELYGILLGCMVGIGLAFGMEKFSKWRSSQTFGVPGYSPSILNVPELGVIPSASVDLVPFDGGSRRIWNRLPLNQKSVEDGPRPVELITARRQQSFLAESFRLTLTSILLMNRRGRQPRTIVVTSPGPGEGKTTVVSNMAIAIAESGRRVLLIDADLRRPRLHTIFNLEQTEGFADLVAHARDKLTVAGDAINGNGAAANGYHASGTDDRDNLVLETQIPGVFVLQSGTTGKVSLSHVFHSIDIQALLDRLSERFDVILIDTPPMLQFSDARLMARFADGLILVVRSGVTGCESAVVAREQLAQDRIEVLGTILNDWDAKHSRNSPHHSYYTAYSQYYGSAAGQ